MPLKADKMWKKVEQCKNNQFTLGLICCMFVLPYKLQLLLLEATLTHSDYTGIQSSTMTTLIQWGNLGSQILLIHTCLWTVGEGLIPAATFLLKLFTFYAFAAFLFVIAGTSFICSQLPGLFFQRMLQIEAYQRLNSL